jgi:3-hydroxyisobutyrate dehydrogenase-like beta-hydroxyacid dehydrogenase
VTASATLGFIGLGVMGRPMCANLTRACGLPVVAYDRDAPALDAAAAAGAERAGSVAEVVARADVVFLSLPSIVEVETVAEEIIAAARRPRIVVDMSTSDVARTRALGDRLRLHGMTLVDAPVARLRQAAKDGTLLITVGASDEVFAELSPLLGCMGSDVVHAGSLGNGQVIKILNNMVVFQIVNALAEAIAVGRASGVDGRLLFETLQLGSADSFQLRKSAMATLVPDEFPTQAFPTKYAIKDLGLALALADAAGLDLRAAKQTMQLLEQTRDAGYVEEYYPVMVRLIDGRG